MKRNVSVGVFLAFVMLSSTVLASYTIQQTVPDYTKQFDDTNDQLEWSTDGLNFREESRFTKTYTSQPAQDGSVYTTVVSSSRIYTMPNGETAVLDQDMGIVGSAYTNIQPDVSLQILTIEGGQTNVAKMNSQFDYYTHKKGEIDRYGGNYNLTFTGFSDQLFLPADLLANPFAYTKTVATGTTGTCNDNNNPCSYQSNHLVLPLCANNNCSTEDHDTTLRIANGDYSPGMTGWSLATNQTNSAIIFEIENEDLNNEQAHLFVRASGEDDWTRMLNGDARTSSFLEYMIAPNETFYSNVHSMPHTIRGELPTAMVHNESYNEQWFPTTTTHAVFMQEGRAYFSAIATHDTNYYRSQDSNENITENLSADYIIWDPEVVYLDDNNVWSNDAKAQSMSWKQGVDRDGGHIYGYAAPRAIELNGGGLPAQMQAIPEVGFGAVSPSLSKDCGQWYSSGLGTGTAGCGSWDNFETGDGWCGESASYGHAGCSVQGFSGNQLNGDHWNTDDTTALPLIDSTYDFDGTVVKVGLDRDTWISQGSWGYDELHVEVGLQAMGYANSLTSNSGWSGGLGGWIGANGGWFENCFNGYIDIYAVPENDFDNWYGYAQYSYPWAPGNSNYAYSATDPSETGAINWGIRPDGDIFSADEYWYEEIGANNNDPLVAMTEKDGDGYTDGPKAGGADHTYDLRNNDYWASMYSHYLGGTISGAQMKVNNFQAHRLQDGYVLLNDDNFEDGGGIYNGDRVPGYDSILNRGEGLYHSSFNHQADYWDINFYSDADFPYGPQGIGDASIGTMQPDGSFGPTSKLSTYHLETAELGTAEQDFCYDPISTTGTPRENNMIGVEADSKILLSHDSTDGQTYLNIDIGSSPYDNILAESATMSTTELVADGWLDDASDDEINFYLLIDIRSRTSWANGLTESNSGEYRTEDEWYTEANSQLTFGSSVPKSQAPNMAVCWGDWATSTDLFDTEDGHWWDWETEQFIAASDKWIYDDGFCLDKYGNNQDARAETSFSDFIDTVTCVSDEPADNQQIGQNPDRGFWCGLNLMSPENDDVEPIRIIAQSAPYIDQGDDDGDGVLNINDLCPNTPTNQEVDLDGCPITDSPTNDNLTDDQDENLPYNGNGDYDGDGVIDAMDMCDTRNGEGYQQDYAWYTQQMHDQFVAAQSTNNPMQVKWYDGCPLRNTDDGSNDDDLITPDDDNCLNVGDMGIYPYEDNDDDGFIDEDWIDGKDNDGDGLIDEDPFDDCEDGMDLYKDDNFNGIIEAIYSVKDVDGRYIPRHGDQVIAEQDNQIDFEYNVYHSTWEEFSSRTADNSEVLVFHDDQGSPASTQLMCNAIETNEVIRTKMQVFVWMPWDEIDRIVASSVNLDYADLNLGKFGRASQSNYSDPGGTGVMGAYVPYGQATLFHNSLTPLPVNTTLFQYSGAALTQAGQLKLASQTDYVSDDPIMFVNFAEGHYKFLCIGEQTKTLQNGQQYQANMVVSQDFTAVAPCPDGDLPSPPNLVGTCDRTTSGGGGITTSDSINSLLDNVVLLGIVIILLALAVLLWFIDWRLASFGVGLLSIAFGLTAGQESELTGTIAHALIAGGLLCLLGSLLDQLGIPLIRFYFPVMSVWFTWHSLALFEIVEEPAFFVNAYTWAAVSLAILFGIISLAQILNVFDIDTPIDVVAEVPAMIDLPNGLLAKASISATRNELGLD